MHGFIFKTGSSKGGQGWKSRDLCQRGQKKQPSVNDIFSWLKPYARFIAVMLSSSATSKDEATGLAAHMHLILQLSGDLRGLQWLRYDQEFREWAAAKGDGANSIWQLMAGVYHSSKFLQALRERKCPKRRQEIVRNLL